MFVCVSHVGTCVAHINSKNYKKNSEQSGKYNKI
jgi:hypothetical protein